MHDGWLRRRYLWYFRRQEVLNNRSRLKGGCARCGHCCGHCIFNDRKHGRCRIYKHRPDICRLFPLTADDIKNIPTCGFTFKDE